MSNKTTAYVNNLLNNGVLKLNEDQSIRDSDGNTIAPKMLEYSIVSIDDTRIYKTNILE